MGAKWQALLRLLPGYDPFKDADGCWFDASAAQNALDFFPGCLTHGEGDLRGKPFELEKWQQCYVANLFGWKRQDAQGREVRRYRESLLYIARKNGKSPLAAGIALYILFCDGEAGQQDYVAAADREQAGMLFRHARAMVEAEPEMLKRARIFGGSAQAGQSKSIVLDADGSFLRVLSADAESKHGGNSHLVLIDELHAQPNRELVDVLTTSTASQNRKQPLTIYITTADFMRPSICNEKYDYACKVRDGLVSDPRFLPAVYEILPADDWTDPAVWKKANPNLDVSVSREYLETECAKAKDNPEYENTFKRLHLNLRTDADVRWLSSHLWDANGDPFDPESLAGRDCYAGLDLANTLDVAALALVFPPTPDDPAWYDLTYFWVPEAVARERERTNRTRYDAWISKGHMHATEGDVIDYNAIRAAIGELTGKYRLVRLAFDPWNATQFATDLAGDGVQVEKFVQSLQNYAEPCRRLVELLKDRKFRHGGQPVLRWMAGNVTVHTDGRGYVMPSRKKSTDKIDGITATLMGLAVALQAVDVQSQCFWAD